MQIAMHVGKCACVKDNCATPFTFNLFISPGAGFNIILERPNGNISRSSTQRRRVRL